MFHSGSYIDHVARLPYWSDQNTIFFNCSGHKITAKTSFIAQCLCMQKYEIVTIMVYHNTMLGVAKYHINIILAYTRGLCVLHTCFFYEVGTVLHSAADKSPIDEPVNYVYLGKSSDISTHQCL